MNERQQKSTSSTHIVFTKNMKICNQLYTLTHKIGSGNFGQVFIGINNSNKPASGTKMVAIKVQKQSAGRSPQLPNQIQILTCLKNDKESLGFPQIFQHGFEKGSHFLVMQLLGPNLNQLMKMCGGKFSLRTTLVLAMQIFERIQFLHSKGFLCRDIKPENFLMGCGLKSSVLYLIDFGLSRRYRDSKVNLHRPYRQERDFSGTLRYASICSHLRIQHSRRDDLQSICYMIIYFLLGTLPWQNNRTDNIQTKQRLILDKKMKISSSQLCSGIPIQFRNILQYCLDLDYYQQPDYEFIQGQLMELYQKQLSGQDFLYDWAMLNREQTMIKDQLIIKVKARDFLREFYGQFGKKGQKQDQMKEYQWQNEDPESYFNTQLL